MAEYIKKDEYCENYCRCSNEYCDKESCSIWKAPAADVAPVIWCEDCQYWQDNNGGYPNEECRWRGDETPDADDFCSYGKRKDGDSNDS